MNADINLETVEKSIFRSRWEDGLIELFFGIGLVLMGILWLKGLIVFVALVPVMLIPFWAPIRKRVTEPRAGYVRFSEERKARTQLGLNMAGIIGFGLLTLFGAVFVVLRSQSGVDHGLMEILVPGLPSFIVATALLVAWLGFGMPRFATHAAVLVAAGVLGVVSALDPGWQFLGSGLVIAGMGSVLFARFLRDNPVAES